MRKVLFRTTVFFGVLLLASSVVLTIVFPASAQSDMAAGESVVLPAGRVVDGNYFASGGTVVVSGTVNGDAYVAGGNVVVEGNVKGDLLVAGGSVTIRGNVGQDVRAAAGHFTVAGTIGKNVTIIGGNGTITDGTRLGGSVVAGTGNLSVFAPIPGDLTVGAGTLLLGNKVSGDVTAGVGKLHLTGDGAITGDLSYWSREEASIDQGATVSGTTKFVRVEQKAVDRTKWKGPAGTGIWAGVKFMNLLSALVVGAVLLLLAPGLILRAARQVIEHPGKTIGVGFLTLFIAPIACVVLFVTVIGIPLALITGAIYLIMLYNAKIVASLAVGLLVLPAIGKRARIGWAFVAGIVLYGIFSFVPFVGWIVGFIALLFGLGAIVLEEFSSYRLLRDKKIL